jgi:inhibitor of cysteine peptidase
MTTRWNEKAVRAFATLGLAGSFVLALSGCERHGGAQPPANAAVSSQSAAPAAGVGVELSEDDSGAALDVDRGTTLVIKLPANPTTGYSWSLVTSGAGVVSQGEPTFVRDASTDKLGAGGAEAWSFTAQQSGEQELRFEYRRAWEREQSPAKVVTYAIRVR